MASKVPYRPLSDFCGSHCSAYRNQRALIMSGLLLIIISFVSGYFWGISNGVEALSTQLDQDAFSDQISASFMPIQTDADELPEDGIEESENFDEEQGVETPGQPVVTERTYYAQLAGFGNKQSAHRFAQKLIKKKIPVIVNPVHSKTKKGKAITWYQVVTESYSTKEELAALVEQLKETEKLKDPQIVYC